MHEPPDRPAPQGLAASEHASLSADARQRLGLKLRALYDGTATPAGSRLTDLLAQLDGAKRKAS